MSDAPRKASFPAFCATTALIFVCAVSAAESVGFVPYYVDGSSPRSRVAIADLPELGEEVVVSHPAPTPGAEASLDTEKPVRIRIPAINLNLPLSNPETRDIAQLDEVLKKSPARYVDSALLGERGNLLIFGHSSHLPVVHNQMYKAFNKVPELKTGDTITVEGAQRVYEYVVQTVTRVDAEEGIIDLRSDTSKLTIVTCDTLTGKSSRFVVDAELIGSYAR